MEFEWDAAKNRLNVQKHGIRFEDACRIFEGYTVDAPDDRFDYGEPRIISIGSISGIVVVVVVHTDRAGVCRIISARKANAKERARYEQAVQEASAG